MKKQKDLLRLPKKNMCYDNNLKIVLEFAVISELFLLFEVFKFYENK